MTRGSAKTTSAERRSRVRGSEVISSTRGPRIGCHRAAVAQKIAGIMAYFPVLLPLGSAGSHGATDSGVLACSMLTWATDERGRWLCDYCHAPIPTRPVAPSPELPLWRDGVVLWVHR